MFPRQVNAIRRYVADIQLFIIIHMIGIGQDIDILEIRHMVILQTESDLHGRSAHEYSCFFSILETYKMEFLLLAKQMRSFYKSQLHFLGKLIKISEQAANYKGIVIEGSFI